MRRSILPLVIILLCSSFVGFSQAGISCGTPYTLAAGPICSSVSIDISSANFITGPARLACGYPNNTVGGKLIFLKFSPSSATACFKINLSTNSVTNVRMEAALYTTGTCAAAPPDPNGLLASNSICFPDGNGLWTRPSSAGNWPGWSAGKAYYLRVYVADAITTALPGTIPPQLNVCATETTPPNDLCVNATRIDGALIGSDNVCATGGASEPINATPGDVCAGALQNTVWYWYNVETAGPSSLTINAINCDGYSGAGSPFLQVGLMIGGCTAATIKPAGPGNSILCGTVGPGAPVATRTSLTLNAPSYPRGTKILVGMDGFLNANCSYNFFITNAIPIPIKLRYFGAWENGGNNHARWITSFELDNAYFEVQRSIDGTNFQSIGRIAGNNNSSHDITYDFDDTHPPLVAYYRLAQYDVDDHSTFSDVVMIKRHQSSAFSVSFANPVQSSSMINISAEKAGRISLQVIDVSGRTLSTQSVDCNRGNNTFVKDFSGLTPGNYYLVVTQEDGRFVKPFVKQ